MRERYDAGGDRGAGTAAGATGAAREIPGIVHRSEELRLGRRIVAELGGLRGADEPKPRFAESRHQFGILGRHEPLGEPATRVAAHVLGVEHQLLDEERHSGEWSRCTTRTLHGKRLQYGVDPRVHLLDRLSCGVGELFRGDVLAGDQLREAKAVMASVIVE